MKRVIRRGVFETNSSSTHSMTICTLEEFNLWKKGELLYSVDEEGLISFDEALEYIDVNDKDKDKDIYSLLKEYGIYTLDSYFDEDELYVYDRYYKTKSGDEIKIFGKYGYQG